MSSTTGKLGLLLNADRDANASGYINISAALTSNGGNITMGGGSGAITGGSPGVPGTGFAVGNSGQASGVFINNVAVSADGGNIIINGQGYDTTTGDNRGVFVYLTSAAITTTGTGTINITAQGKGITNSGFDRGLSVESGGIISTADGSLTVNATGGGAGTGVSNYGVYVSSANSAIKTTGAGALSVTGTGGNANGGYNYGVYVTAANAITTTGTGNVTVNGTGGAGTGVSNIGVYVSTSGTITAAANRNITIIGAGGNGAGNYNYGVCVNGASAAIAATGSGTINITAQGKGITNSGNDYGLYVGSGGIISTADGSLTVNGTGGGAGIGSYNCGVYVNSTGSTIKTTGTGALSVTGTGGNASGSGNNNYGVNSAIANGIQTTGSGSLTVTGYGGNGSGSGNSNCGVYVGAANAITTTGTGDVTVNGTGGNSLGTDNYGVFVNTPGSITVAANHNITIIGTGGNGSGSFNYGVLVNGASAAITATGSGAIDITALGKGTTNSGSDYGLYVESGGIISTADGSLTVNATGGGAGTGTDNYGVLVSGTNSTIKTTGAGNLSVTGIKGNGTSYGVNIAAAYGLQTTGTGNITVLTNTILLAEPNDINSVGSLTIAPSTASETVGVAGGAGTLALSSTYLGYLTYASLQIGNSSQTGAVTVNTYASWAKPISFVTNASGSIVINGAQTNSSSVTFNGPTALSAAITASSLNIAGSTFNAGSQTITLTGTGAAFTNAGTFTYGTSKVSYTNAVSATVLSMTGAGGANGYYNLDTNGAGTFTLGGDIAVNNVLSITAGNLTAGSYTITIGGSWSNSGTFTPQQSTVTFNAAATGKTINPGASSFYNVVFNGSGGGWTEITNNMTVTNNLTVTNGTFDLAALDLAVTGNLLINGGTLNVSNASSDLDINGNVTVSSGTLSAPAVADDTSFTVGGNWDVSGTGIFTPNAGRVVFDTGATGKTINPGGSSFYDLTFNGSGGEWDVQNNLTVVHNLTITNGTLDMAGYGFSVGSTAVIDPAGNSSGTLNSSQRRSFFDTANSRYWAFYYTGSAIEYSYSSNGTAWTTSSTVPDCNTAQFSVAYKNISSASYAFVAADSGIGGCDVTITRGACGADSITSWSTAAIVFDGASSANSYSNPTIALDSSNYIWVGARHYEQGHYYQAYVARSANPAIGDLSTANWDRIAPVGGAVGGHSSTLGSLVLMPGVSRNMSLLAVGESNNITHYTFTNGTPSWSAANTGGDYAWFTFPYDDLNGTVHAMTVIGADIYVGGDFTAVGGLTVNRIAKYTPSTQQWAALGSTPGVNNSARAFAVDGSNNLYVGGLFTTAGGSDINRVAKWNGSAWSALGTGADGDVYALKIIGTDLYAGGNFTYMNGATAANYIAKWDGVTLTWGALGSGMDQRVRSLAVIGSDLYAGGDFTTAGGTAVNYIAKWDSIALTWSALGTTGTDGRVYAMAVDSSNNLYVGGNFNHVNGATDADYAAKWTPGTPGTWTALGTGMNGMVYALAAIDANHIYVGGDFTYINGTTPANYAAIYHSGTWEALNTGAVGTNGRVRALTALGGNIYAGGEFTTAGGTTTNYISKYTPGANPPSTGAWTTLSAGTLGANNTVYALTALGADVYVGGSFTTAGGVTVNRIAKYTPSTDTWSALIKNGNIGVDNTVRALAVIGQNLYVGGYFATAGGVTVNRVARWTGAAWEALNTGTPGVNSYVMALTALSDELYVGGYFTTAGGTAGFNRIAKYTPSTSTWSTLGTGMNATGTYYVNALAVLGADLYAGGKFTTAGGQSAGNIAKWSGSWSALGTGTSDIVNAIAADIAPDPDVIYVGGFFLTAGGTTVNRIAKWTPGTAAWSALIKDGNTGVSNTVRALAVLDSALYVGGDFTTAGGVTVNRVAKWTGSTWAATNTGDNIGMSSGSVYALAVDDSDLYAGGSFIRVKGLSSGYYARYGWAAAADINPNNPISSVSDIVGNIHQLYFYPAANYLLYSRFNIETMTWGNAATVYSGASSSPAISIDTADNSLHAFWVSSNTVYGKSGAIQDVNTRWDANTDTIYAMGTNVNLLSMYEVNSLKTPLLWTQQTGGTYDVTSALVTGSKLTLSVGGNWSNAGTFNAGASTVVLSGASGQTVTMGGPGSAFANITVTNTSAAGVTFSDALYAGALNATAGGQKLYFGITGTHTITDSFNVSGILESHTILGRFGGSGSDRWNISAPVPTTVTHLTVSNSASVNAITAASSTSGGNNDANWNISP